MTFYFIFAQVKKDLVKRIISISFVALSSLVLLILAIVPHHHHEGLVCIVMEICEQDNQVNDEHTDHRELPNDSDHEQSCIAESKYTSPKTTNETKCKVSSCQNHDLTHLFPIFFLAADFLIYDSGESTSDFEYGEFISFYKSAVANQFQFLLAPPSIIS